MTVFDQPWRPQRRLAALALTAAVHLALAWAWLLARHPALPAPDETRSAIQWLWLKPDAPAAPLPAEPAIPKARAGRAASVRSPAPQPAAPPAPQQADPFAAPAAAPATAPTRLEALLGRAKRDIGKIDQELRKERRGLIQAPPDSAQLRMQRGVAEAADLAANKWYQAPKITELVDPGGYGRKRYRVVGAGGTYCVTYESNHAPDAIDAMKNGIKAKVTSCPRHEQAATNQAWE
jgi:hypothetical protein